MVVNKNMERINRDTLSQVKKSNLENGLEEIYQDDDGEIVDVSRLKIRKKRSFLWQFLKYLVILSLLGGLAYGVYYYLNSNSDATNIDLSIEAEKSVMNGDEVTYTVHIVNNGRIEAKDLEMHLGVPDNFIMTSFDNNYETSELNTWKLGNLSKGATTDFKFKGRLYNLIGSTNTFTADLTYQPANFSSVYKKSTLFENNIGNSGIEATIVKPASALINDKQKLVIKYKLAENSTLDNVRITVEPSNPADVEFIQEEGEILDGIKQLKPWVYQAYKLDNTEREIKISFKVIDKPADKMTFKVKFDYWLPAVDSKLKEAVMSTSTIPDSRLGIMMPAASSTGTSSPSDLLTDNDKYFTLDEKSFDIELVKNDLNLLLVLNGSDKDTSADFGQILRYSINYENKGESPMEDVSIKAVLDGELIDWKSFQDKYRGEVGDNSVTWTKEEIPDLAILDKGEKGVIDFSVRIKEEKAVTNLKVSQITAVSRFETKKIGDVASAVQSAKEREEIASIKDGVMASGTPAVTSTANLINNSSNTIICKLNSDLRLEEKVRYFDEDNISVGSGPMPLETGKTTNVRVYWTLKNSMHNLSNIRVAVDLPAYVKMSGKQEASLGMLSYDAPNNRILWEISSLNKESGDVTASFNVAITPLPEHKNQLLIILPKTKLNANDDEINSQINKEMKAKSTKFEDDDILRSVNIDLNGGLVK